MSENNKDIVIRISSKNIIELLVGAVIGIVLTVLLSTQTLNTYDNTGKTAEDYHQIATYAIDSTKIERDTEEYKSVLSDVQGLVSDIRDNASYAQIQLSEDSYMYYLYNKEHEIFIQDSEYINTEIILNNGRALKYNSEQGSLIDGYDMDIASLIENSFNAVGTEGIQLFDMNLGDELDENTHEYRIDFVGDEAAKQLYSSLSDEFATDMVDGIKESMKEETNKDWETHIILVLRINNKDFTKSYGRMLYVQDKEEYTNWVFQGYTHVNEWDLNDEWYDYIPSNDKTGERYSELIDGTMNVITNTLEAYADEQGWKDEYLEVEDIQEDTSDNNSVSSDEDTSSNENDSKSEETETSIDEDNKTQ